MRLGDGARDRPTGVALIECKRSLKSAPNRFRTLYGAAKAADAAGDRAKAKHYFRELNRVADKADTPLPDLAEATAYLAQ